MVLNYHSFGMESGPLFLPLKCLNKVKNVSELCFLFVFQCRILVVIYKNFIESWVCLWQLIPNIHGLKQTLGVISTMLCL